MREWLARLRCVRGMEWAAAAIAVGVIALLLTAQPDTASQYEKRVRQILECVEGAGQVSVMISEYEKEGSMHTGVVVMAEGADSIRVCMELTRAVCTLTGAEEADVEVIRMKGDKKGL